MSRTVRQRREIRMELKQLLADTERQYQAFLDILPSKVSRESVSNISKSALKAYLIRAGLLHRTADLAGAAIDLYSQHKDLPAFVLTRAALETFALFYYFIKKLEEAVISGKVQDLDETLMRLLFGARNADNDVKAINVLTAVDRLDKDVNGTRRMYDELCEIGHPNWMGTLGHYGKAVESPYTLYFESTYEGVPPEAGLGVVSGILGDLLEMDKSVQDILLQFKTLHEQEYDGGFVKEGH
ncbi:soluble NSF attachment family protein [Candidatus Bathyarchaeota archaeon]|nr:soluble NSF attachment family protein [Candidatus Bathyarchaeota archaeon]